MTDGRTVEEKLAKLESIESAERARVAEKAEKARVAAEKAQQAREAATAEAAKQEQIRKAIAHAKWLESVPEDASVTEVLRRHPNVKDLTRCPHCQCQLLPNNTRLGFALLLLEAEERERARHEVARQRADAKVAHDRHMRELCNEYDIRSVHPFVDLFPMLPPEQMEGFVASIAKSGLEFPITLDRDRVLLDGRIRLAACKLAGVRPTFTVYEGDDPVSFIVCANVLRQSFTPDEIARMEEMVKG